MANQDEAEETPAVPAATVVLLRDAADGLETLMLRRNSRLAFAGGAWVFPGGRIDPDDYPADAEMLTAARNAAVREAHEEADLSVAPDGLVWFAHWTPAQGRPNRFATWFFMTRAPEGAVTVDRGEIHEHRWIRPADAIHRSKLGEIELVPPTWVTLFMLGDHTTVDAALAFARSRPPEHYQSKMGTLDGVNAVFWSGDAAYDDGDLTKPGPRNRLLMLTDGWRLERTA